MKNPTKCLAFTARTGVHVFQPGSQAAVANTAPAGVVEREVSAWPSARTLRAEPPPLSRLKSGAGSPSGAQWGDPSRWATS